MNVDYDDFVIVDMFSVKLGMICVCWLGIHGFLFNPCISFYESEQHFPGNHFPQLLIFVEGREVSSEEKCFFFFFSYLEKILFETSFYFMSSFFFCKLLNSNI
jgi:hypothetical protein